MKRFVTYFLFLSLAGIVSGERIVDVPYGSFEQWTVRYINESKIIGGKERTLYTVGRTDTIRGNQPYYYLQSGSPWSVSDAYAVVAGIHKAASSVSPERRGSDSNGHPTESDGGTCCRLDVKMMSVVVLGIIDIHVLATGSLFWGRTLEPITTAKDPYQYIDFGIPFTKRPAYLEFDYKCRVSPDRWIWCATGLSPAKKIEGHDECEVYMLLQKRWEDDKGEIHALRVGTAYERYGASVQTWQNSHRIRMHYGDFTSSPDYQPYMGLTRPCRAMNSRGRMTLIHEDGWASPNEQPTHAILMFTAGCYNAFYGHDGNVLWVDNVKLVYEEPQKARP